MTDLVVCPAARRVGGRAGSCFLGQWGLRLLPSFTLHASPQERAKGRSGGALKLAGRPLLEMFTKFSHNAVAFNRRVNVCQFHVPPTQRLSLATKLPRIEFRRNAVTAAEPVVKRTRLFSLRNLGRLFKGLTILGIGYAGYCMYQVTS